MSIRIIIDSASDLNTNPLDGGQNRPDLTVLPMTVTFGTEEYQDGVNLTKKQFFEKLVECSELPKTSMIPMIAFADAISAAREKGEEVIVITMSSKLSGTYQSALAAKEACGNEGIYVVDSMSVTISEHVLIDYALSLVDSGKSAAEIVEALEKKKGDVCLIALLDTLEYLRRGGRISNVAGMIGGILSIKPVIAIVDGQVAMLGKARGSKNGYNLLTEHIDKAGGIDFSMPILLGYSGLSDELLEKYVEDSSALWQGQVDNLRRGMIGGTIGTHVGPGAIAVAFFKKS